MFHSTHDTGVGSWNRTFNKLKVPAARARARDQCLFTENSGIVLGEFLMLFKDMFLMLTFSLFLIVLFNLFFFIWAFKNVNN